MLDFYDSEFLLKPCYYFEFDKNGNVICSENRSNELYGYNEISRINYKGNFYANVVAENKEFALKIARERMNKYYLKPKYVKKKQNQTSKRIEERVKSNLVKKRFNVDKPNKILVTDITYLIHKSYLSIILDLCDIKVVAYKTS